MASFGCEDGDSDAVDNCDDTNKVLFKSDRMYKHNILQINHTTYDVRRSQDVINPRTSRRDIMLLANHDSNEARMRMAIRSCMRACLVYTMSMSCIQGRNLSTIPREGWTFCGFGGFIMIDRT
jgi:hypothetical protein